MGLQVWLPLNGDLHNQGLSDITITGNAGATYYNNGKIGKAINLNKRINITCNQLAGLTSFSVAFWAKTMPSETLTTNWQDLLGFTDISTNGSTGQFRFETCYALTYKGVHWHDNATNAIVNGAWTPYPQEQNVWHHYCVVIKENEYIKSYLDGVLNQTITTSLYGGHLRGDFWIGETNNIEGALNDVRIYDHCLSAKEVEEIAKGLILHYPLNNNGLGNKNLITDFDTSFLSYSNSSVNLFTNQMNNGTQEIVSNISGANKCLHLKNLGGNNRQYRTLSLQSGKTYTISTDYYSNNAQSTAWRGELNGGDYSWKGSETIGYTTPGKWQRLSYTYNNLTTDTTLFFFIYCSVDTDCYIKNIKIEEGPIATPWSPAVNNDIIYDTSGYNNNSTMIGTLTTISNTLRYNCSTLFNGTDNAIVIPYNDINPTNIFTVNLWFYKNALGSKGYETLFGGPSGFEMDVRAGTATTLSLYMASTRGGNVYSPFNFNEWYMVTMVRNSINELYYVNGTLVKTIEAKSMPIGNYYIGAWASSTQQNYYGNISDFRIYATALTDAQILELYNTSMTIDNQGNIYARELVEQ